MKKLSATIIAALVGLACSPAASETLSVKNTFKASESFTTDEADELRFSTGTFMFSESAKHSFEITPEQEALLAENCELEVECWGEHYSVDFSDDPNWQPGDTSIKVDISPKLLAGKRASGSIGKGSLTAKWGKGKFTVSIKMKISVSDTETIKSTTRDQEPAWVETEIETSGDDIEETAFYSYDMTMTQSQSIKATGLYSGSISEQMKSKSMIDPPMDL